MATLKEFFEYVRRVKAELVVWRHVTAYLDSEFTSSDAMSAKSKLQMDDEDGNGEIPEDLVQEVIDTIFTDHIAPRQKRLVHLMDTELDDALNKLRAEKEEERQLEEPAEEEPKPAKLKKAKSK
jgi:hypothetical protein